MKAFEKQDKKPLSAESVLKDVKTDGDSASGTVVTKVEGKEHSSPVKFKKVDGSWKMEFDLDMGGKEM